MSKKTIVITELVFFVLISLWMWIIAPHLTKVSADFSYRAEIISIDNLYDETQQRFSGEQRSVTSFSYTVAEEKQGVLVVKNSFDVHKITGEKIFSVDRFYGIDPTTQKHVAGFGDENRDGYLFAPMHLKKGEPFTYWHINYDGPAHMTFVGEETIADLTVYRYETRYAGVRIDQTKNLTNVPGVGITRGIELEPYLQMWIEPVSGRLVKYTDDTTAYYYDLKTGVRQNPWNHFSNTYTLASILRNVELAQQEKWNVISIDFIIPALLASLALIIILFHYRKNNTVKLLSLGILGAALIFGSVRVLNSTSGKLKPYDGPIEKLRIGAESSLLSSPVWVAEYNGYFKAEGIEPEITKFSSGRDALNAMLNENNLDMVTVAQTPIVINSFSRNDYKVLAGFANSPNDVKILARQDRDIRAPLDLRGKKIGITKGSTGHYFLSLFLAQQGMDLHDVDTVDFKASDLPQATVVGTIDAMASWGSYIYDAQKALGKNSLLLESKGTFREDFYFVAFNEWINTNPDLAKRFLSAIDAAEKFITEHPDEAQRIVGKNLDLDPAFISSMWNEYHFQLFLDQSVLLTFEQQARWAQTNKLVTSSTTPNYLNFIYSDALETIKPEAVTVIH